MAIKIPIKVVRTNAKVIENILPVAWVKVAGEEVYENVYVRITRALWIWISGILVLNCNWEEQIRVKCFLKSLFFHVWISDYEKREIRDNISQIN